MAAHPRAFLLLPLALLLLSSLPPALSNVLPGSGSSDESSHFNLNRISFAPRPASATPSDPDHSDADDQSGSWTFSFGWASQPAAGEIYTADDEGELSEDGGDGEDPAPLLEDSPETETPVVEDGEVVAPFSTCSVEAPSASSCFFEPPATDRVDFNFFYTARALDLEKPTVLANPPAAMEPAVVEFDDSMLAGYGGFSVAYNCRNSGGATSAVVTLKVALKDDKELAMSWVKQCPAAGGEAPVELGYQEKKEGGGEVAHAFVAGAKVVVGKDEPSTGVYAMMTEKGHLEMGRVALKVANTGVMDVEVRGAFLGGPLSEQPVFVHVFYKCKKTGSSQLDMTIPVPPFKDVRASWTKDCVVSDAYKQVQRKREKEANDLFTIGTDRGEPDVFREHVVASKFKMTMADFLRPPSPDFQLFSQNVMVKSFYVEYAENEGANPLVVHDLSISVSDPSVVAVLIDTESSEFAEGIELDPGEKADINLRMICKQRGAVNVLVSLSMEGLDKVEFGFVKECLHRPRKIRRSRMAVTAGGMTKVILFVALTGVTLLAFRMRAIFSGGTRGVGLTSVKVTSN